MEKEEAEKWAAEILQEFREMMNQEWLEMLNSLWVYDENSWKNGFYRGYIKGEQNTNKRMKNE